MHHRSRLIRPVASLVLGVVTLVPALHAGAAPSDYVVRPGDSLYVIASRLDVRLDELLRVNGLRLTSLILPGQRLVVPGPGAGTPAAPPPGAGSTVGAAGATTDTVRAGDGLARIASRNGVPLRALLAANGLTVTSLIVPGQRLVIPRTGTPSGAPSGGGTGGASSGGSSNAGSIAYTVQRGDWLARIASRHGVTLDALLKVNGMTATSLIVPGQQLRIPRPGAPATPPTPNRPAPPSQPSRPAQPAPPAPPAAGPAYTVRPGDSLGAIAAQHDVTLAALLGANGFTSGSLITPGMQISLPVGARLNALDRVLGYALAQVGKPWKFWSRGPDAFDCSGLTLAAYSQVGVTLIHQSAAQARQGRAVDFPREPIRAGDLVFQDTDGDGVINHVGIALGPGTWVHSRSATRPVAWGPMPAAGNIVTVRRVLS